VIGCAVERVFRHLYDHGAAKAPLRIQVIPHLQRFGDMRVGVKNACHVNLLRLGFNVDIN
jgi:hypothetical protein